MLTVTVNATIHAPLDRVFDYVTTAKHWPEWHPVSLAVSGDVDGPMHTGSRVIERARFNGAEKEDTWTVVEHVPLQKVVLTASNTAMGPLKIAYAFEEDRREVRFTRSMLVDLAASVPNLSDESLEAHEKEFERQSIRALSAIKRILETRH